MAGAIRERQNWWELTVRTRNLWADPEKEGKLIGGLLLRIPGFHC